MPGLFYKTVSALCYDVSYLQAPGSAAAGPSNEVSNFVLESWAAMPRFLAWPIRIATVGFAASSLLTTGSFYHQLSPGRRRARLDAWRYSRVRVLRDVIRFHFSLATLMVYQHKGVLPAAEVALPDLEARGAQPREMSLG